MQWPIFDSTLNFVIFQEAVECSTFPFIRTVELESKALSISLSQNWTDNFVSTGYTCYLITRGWRCKRKIIMANSLYETRLQGVMVFVFVKTNIQSKMINTTTMIPCRHVAWRESVGIDSFKNFDIPLPTT